MLMMIALRQWLYLLRNALPGPGINPARADAIHPDIGPQAHRKGMSQCNDATFGGGIGFRVRLGLQRPGGGHVYDGTLGFPKIRNRVLGYQKGARQVYVEPALPLCQAEFFNWPGIRIRNRGIIDD